MIYPDSRGAGCKLLLPTFPPCARAHTVGAGGEGRRSLKGLGSSGDTDIQGAQLSHTFNLRSCGQGAAASAGAGVGGGGVSISQWPAPHGQAEKFLIRVWLSRPELERSTGNHNDRKLAGIGGKVIAPHTVQRPLPNKDNLKKPTVQKLTGIRFAVSTPTLYSPATAPNLRRQNRRKEKKSEMPCLPLPIQKFRSAPTASPARRESSGGRPAGEAPRSPPLSLAGLGQRRGRRSPRRSRVGSGGLARPPGRTAAAPRRPPSASRRPSRPPRGAPAHLVLCGTHRPRRLPASGSAPGRL